MRLCLVPAKTAEERKRGARAVSKKIGEALRLEEDESAVLYCGRCDEKYRVWSVNGLFEVEAMEE